MLMAYACSGFGGLVYQVTWTRLLTLHVGHTTAAVVAVVAAFMGGLGAGAAIGSYLAGRWSPVQCLTRYAVVEVVVAAYAIALSLSIDGLTPLLRWSYSDGSGSLFNTVRSAVCISLVGGAAVLLGATFPISLRAFGAGARDQAAVGSRLYALEHCGSGCWCDRGWLYLVAFGWSPANDYFRSNGQRHCRWDRAAFAAVWRLGGGSHS